MKIVHLANHVQVIGNGIVNVMVDLACSQAKAGHEVMVASSGGEFEALLQRYGVQHVKLVQSRQPARVPGMVLGFNRLLRRFDPDIVHAHMMTGAVIARFGTLRRRFALVTTVHNEFQRSASLMGLGDHVVGVSEAVSAAMAKRGVAASKLSTVRNGTIGTPRFDGVPMPESPALRRPSISTLAGMYERKGIRDLLHAFAALRQSVPQASLYLLGDGPDRAAMEALAVELGLSGHAHFTGFIANPAAHLAETDVFVLASRQEPAGLVLCEAREAGCAVVATRVGGIPEMVDGGEAGLLVPANNPAALASAIGSLLTDEGARAALAARGRVNLHAFSVQRMSDAYLTIYARTLEEHGAHRPDLAGARHVPLSDRIVR
jgi:glycosyltransferase involved in cell wall biosynthesis